MPGFGGGLPVVGGGGVVSGVPVVDASGGGVCATTSGDAKINPKTTKFSFFMIPPSST